MDVLEAKACRCGSSSAQGLHHVAKKEITTGLPVESTEVRVTPAVQILQTERGEPRSRRPGDHSTHSEQHRNDTSSDTVQYSRDTHVGHSSFRRSTAVSLAQRRNFQTYSVSSSRSAVATPMYLSAHP